ncbi:hypothetical protein D0Z07_1900 [Hyphodiscus hymeniophilus]|uniref:BZIP domain-containing protein n=1 Tax=Hyphodiscus hymeniophilus TaxID=353542 RepID=A0A9P6VPD9_9HELO|nr:hypothetical protein D0Z07_1900 [Hyphodiscus hymeniophilus]
MHGAEISKDDWIVIDERQERKKRQNRLNQRALRERKRKDEVRVVTGKRPYRVSRWRIGFGGESQEQHRVNPSCLTVHTHISTPRQPSDEQSIEQYARGQSTPEPGLEPLSALVERIKPKACSTPSSSVNFPLSADHLIRLIHQNVFFALMQNKSILSTTTYLTKPAVQSPALVIPPSRDFCDGLTLIHPIIEHPLPQSLHPTPLQSTIPHAAWLNIFPWPRFRDNLIVNESIFDGGDLLCDLFGDLFAYNGPSRNEIDFDKSGGGEKEDGVHGGRRGLIIWGEPWDTEAWEVTQGFMEKWSWLLTGCEDLVEVSNRRRATRDEDPLRWEVVIE